MLYQEKIIARELRHFFLSALLTVPANGGFSRNAEMTRPVVQTQGKSDQRVRLRRDVGLTALWTMRSIILDQFSSFRTATAAVSRISDGLILMPAAFVEPGTGCRAQTS
jgi:hypothetical protein